MPTEVEEDGGTSLPQGKAPAVPTEVEGGGENLPRGKAPAVPANVDRDERAKDNGTPAWWVGRGYEPTLAHLLVTNDVRPEDVRARAPKSIPKLLFSEMPKPFGWRSGQIMASAVESVARQVMASTVDVAASKARRISMVGTTNNRHALRRRRPSRRTRHLHPHRRHVENPSGKSGCIAVQPRCPS